MGDVPPEQRPGSGLTRRGLLERSAALGVAISVPGFLGAAAADASTTVSKPNRGGHLRVGMNDGGAGDSLAPWNHIAALGTWSIHYLPPNGTVVVTDREQRDYFANSSFAAFAECLVAYDRGCKRIQRECGDDSGEDWDKSDVIIEEMQTSLSGIDPPAMGNEQYLWPYLLNDIRG